jgi:hypothetical protein
MHHRIEKSGWILKSRGRWTASLYVAVGLLTFVNTLGCRANTSPKEYWRQWSQIELKEYFTIKGKVDADKDISGIACINERYGLLGADEDRNVYFIEVSRKNKVIKILGDIELLSSGDEIDIEAIVAEDDYYYITGSHGLSKKQGDIESNRFKLFRLKVNPETGMPFERAKSKADFLTISSLTTVLSRDPLLGQHFRKPLQQKGVNVEGLAIKNDILYVGLRSPNLDGNTFVVELAADDLFNDVTNIDYRLHKLHVGNALGIREIVRARDCFLIIAGNSGSEPSDEYPQSQDYQKDRGFEIFCWDGRSSEVHKIGRIPEAAGKAEAMMVLSENAEGVDVLILFDGPKDGKPTVYSIR